MARTLRIGDVTVGGGAPVVVQSMTKTDTRDVAATVRQIRTLEDCGCEIVRIAVPDKEAAEALSSIKRGVHIPIIADIHFDHRLAIAAVGAGVDGLRINPGNISQKKHIAAIVRAAKPRGIPIRIGVNAGSLPKSADGGASLPERMVEAALQQIRLLESMDFDLIKVSLKAFDVPSTIEAYQFMARKTLYPLHLGITEAGLPRAGIIRSAVGIGVLLHQGIGDTIRVSLTGDPEEEVVAAYEILKSLNLRERGPTLLSCPTCGRCEVDLVSLAKAVEDRLSTIDRSIKVAVMGCVVNGPGEARSADVGIACGKGRGAIFRKGEVVRTVEEKDFLEVLMEEVVKI
ncbi:MAG: 4-hydroxy-3-methylbut-2-en-1-yl diphosphate synthase [Chloroflexi bacterium RBG_13_53_26]|nr:MAG: 4-hydroxy-3-methylbut-2-en-1-yl diphosphate synthase [Chloroflexi bacterium RBG_13_53_26]